ncbi:MAG: hypothetical protein HOD92_00485, partial [Deltaproteobacteria bacterium]|nr:hypothetical protein [Deltaproteobacteria bacterium]
DSKRIVFTDAAKKALIVLESETFKEEFYYFTHDVCTDCCFSPDGKSIVAGDRTGNICFLRLM